MTSLRARRPNSRANRRASFSSVGGEGLSSSGSGQASLFPEPAEGLAVRADADLDLGPELLGAIHTALRLARERGWGRERVVDRMNAHLPDADRPVTLRQLYAWTAQSKEFHEFPGRYLPALCAATECDLPLRVLAQSLHLDLVDARQVAAQKLGETQVEINRLRKRAAELERGLAR